MSKEKESMNWVKELIILVIVCAVAITVCVGFCSWVSQKIEEDSKAAELEEEAKEEEERARKCAAIESLNGSGSFKFVEGYCYELYDGRWKVR